MTFLYAVGIVGFVGSLIFSMYTTLQSFKTTDSTK